MSPERLSKWPLIPWLLRDKSRVPIQYSHAFSSHRALLQIHQNQSLPNWGQDSGNRDNGYQKCWINYAVCEGSSGYYTHPQEAGSKTINSNVICRMSKLSISVGHCDHCNCFYFGRWSGSLWSLQGVKFYAFVILIMKGIKFLQLTPEQT